MKTKLLVKPVKEDTISVFSIIIDTIGIMYRSPAFFMNHLGGRRVLLCLKTKPYISASLMGTLSVHGQEAGFKPKEIKKPNTLNPVPDFNDTITAYTTKSTKELLRGAACFGLCKVPALVNKAENILTSSEKVLGRPVTEKALKATLFGHFCAGEDADHITPGLENLEKYGIGFILDYATEGDCSSPDSTEEGGEIQTASSAFRTVGRTNLESEAQRDKYAEEFKMCIHNAASIGLHKDSYVAIKLSALANPALLNRMSKAVTEAKRLFEALDIEKNGTVSREDFEMGYK